MHSCTLSASPPGPASAFFTQFRIASSPTARSFWKTAGHVWSLGVALLTWSPAGYAERRRRPANREATAITPPSLIAILSSGWTSELPLLHPSATG